MVKSQPIILLIVLIHLSGCSTKKYNLINVDLLKKSIIASIEIPENKLDTLIYESYLPICAHSADVELQRTFNPQLELHQTKSALESKFKGKILYTKDDLTNQIGSNCINKSDPWTCFLRNKIEMSISGWILSDKSIEIYERYYIGNKVISIDKRFDYKNGDWSSKLIGKEQTEI